MIVNMAGVRSSLFFVLWISAMNLCACGAELKRPVSQNQKGSASLLSAPSLDVESTAPPIFHDLFSENNYSAVLQLVDLSYGIIKDFDFQQGSSPYKASEMALMHASMDQNKKFLRENGWSVPLPIAGKTGRDNIDADQTAIVSSHSAQRLIIVTFHGSRNGEMNPLKQDSKGDWGANYDSEPVVPSSVGLTELSDEIKIHRGISRNLSSAKIGLFEAVDSIIQRWDSSTKSKSPIWVWTVGHSKGGALAGLGAALFKAHVTSNPSYSHVQVGAICLSSPKVFFGEASKKWVYGLVGQSNIFRINVNGDPATFAPGPMVNGYRSVGVLFLDFITSVNLRTRQHYGSQAYGWLNLSEVVNYHYATSARGFGSSFDPHVVMSYKNLVGGFEEGRLHLLKQGKKAP